MISACPVRQEMLPGDVAKDIMGADGGLTPTERRNRIYDMRVQVYSRDIDRCTVPCAYHDGNRDRVIRQAQDREDTGRKTRKMKICGRNPKIFSRVRQFHRRTDNKGSAMVVVIIAMAFIGHFSQCFDVYVTAELSDEGEQSQGEGQFLLCRDCAG